MEQNVFDIGYELHYVGQGRAHLSRNGELPIIEFSKNKRSERYNRYDYQNTSCWALVPLTMTDEKLDAILPKNWRQMCFDGFSKMSDVKLWLSTHGKFAEDYRATKRKR